MLKAEHRDWLQAAALEVRAIEKRGTSWHGTSGLVGYLIFALGLMAVGGIFFGNKEIGTAGAALALIGAVGLGFYYHHKKTEGDADSKRRREIEEQLKRHGMEISWGGQTVSNGGKQYDPMLTSSYE